VLGEKTPPSKGRQEGRRESIESIRYSDSPGYRMGPGQIEVVEHHTIKILTGRKGGGRKNRGRELGKQAGGEHWERRARTGGGESKCGFIKETGFDLSQRRSAVLLPKTTA